MCKGPVAQESRASVCGRREVWLEHREPMRGDWCGEDRAASCSPLTGKKGLDLNLGAAVGGADGLKAGWGSQAPASGGLWG